MSDVVHDAALADMAGLMQRHAGIFRPAQGGRVAVYTLVGVAAALALYAFWRLEFSFARLGSGFLQLVHFLSLMWPPTPGKHLVLFVHALGETLAIAFLGTLIAAVLAFPVGFLAARNIVPNLFAHFAVRRCLDTVRGVDVLIWALVFINVVGLGPFAGILAIAVSNFGIFGKLFSEAIETSDRHAVEGVVAAGGSSLHAIRFGIMPQVFPVLASQVLYYFESNTRDATIIGIVGAGGIGLHLYEQIRVLEWGMVAFLILMILMTVAVIDWVSSRLRLAIIGRTTLVS
jgi:phosphonate transport system permease protein